MHDDESAIRELVKNWLQASVTGDLPAIESLMADDVVFLRPGQPPMRGRQAFARAFAAVPVVHNRPPKSEIQEIVIEGHQASLWNHLDLDVTVNGKGLHLAGHVLSVLRKTPEGTWLLVRDANLLAPV